jgi:uncharacterized protein (TIGR00299 family) protein
VGASVRGKHLHLDAPAGIAGDMTLGALFDLGVPEEVVRAALAMLPVAGYRLELAKCLRGGIAGTDVTVRIDAEVKTRPHDHHHHGDEHHHDHEHHHDDDHPHEHDHHHDHAHGAHAHRHYREIRTMLAELPGEIRHLALAMFDPIARAEAKLHGVGIDDVVFHEVGAIDSIVDIVGTAAALAWLAPVSISSTPLALGHGTVHCAHGVLPVPAPATVEILRASGVPGHDGGAAFELTTPTGAAIVAALATSFGAMPAGRLIAVGYGAGDRELADRPNLLRAVIVEPAATALDVDSVVQVEANLDDLNPELCEHVAERLFAAGALDVWWQPVTMKKGRPAIVLGVLALPSALDAVARVVFAETSSIGIRHQLLARRVLDRRVVHVHTVHGTVAVKIASQGGHVYNRAPEYEDCRRVARERDVPLKDVYAAALAAAAEVSA